MATRMYIFQLVKNRLNFLIKIVFQFLIRKLFPERLMTSHQLVNGVSEKKTYLYSERDYTMVKNQTDSGIEFALHKYIAEKLGSESYFAHSYSSWERGLKSIPTG